MIIRMDDNWIYIPGFSGYRVNDRGEILSLRRPGSPGCILKTRINEKGYPRVTLYGDDGRKRCLKVHNIIALVWHGPRPDGLVARHLDGNQLNNVPSNIVYGTYSENAFDQVRHGVHPMASRDSCVNGHEFTPENTMRRKTKNGDVRKCKECHRLAVARYRARKAHP